MRQRGMKVDGTHNNKKTAIVERVLSFMEHLQGFYLVAVPGFEPGTLRI